MTPAQKLLAAIGTCELPHPHFMEHFQPLKQRIENALGGRASRIERIMGPSRVGKSMLINALVREFGETKIDGRRRVPVLVVPVPTPATTLELPKSVVGALGMPVQRSITSGAMGTRMLEQLKLVGTRVIIFEEASHLVEEGSRVPVRAAADWFKALADSHNLTLLLFGVPRLKILFDNNEQLRLRASAPRLLLPYDSRVADDMRAFHSCVAAFANLFAEHRFPIALSPAALTYQCYLLSGGLIGIVSRFMQELADRMASDAQHTLTFADCHEALKGVTATGSPNFPAFESPDTVESAVAPAALHQAFLQVVRENDLAVPIIKNKPEAVQ
ncbi:MULTISPECIES: ATP-binding protein [unclassified Caballeronia]|uniref:ATP-binding protein n=1 Tax=unclassified Caballeronia TaxID=2646786 RepID=UPI002864451F|nr:MULTISPECIES: ATP-binding protein [unclassified Caballeronia]MDR5752155.1 ATP-binding protein [Caballeronia sp. LZ024]MDR5843704.1 ATP-binding protein [Caballeronia sp. LZ031]